MYTGCLCFPLAGVGNFVLIFTIDSCSNFDMYSKGF